MCVTASVCRDRIRKADSMAYEDAIINTLVRRMEADALRRSIPVPCSDSTEDDIRLLESWMALKVPRTRIRRKVVNSLRFRR